MFQRLSCSLLFGSLGRSGFRKNERTKHLCLSEFLNSCTLRACYNYKRDKGKSSKAFWYSFLHNVSITYLCLIIPLLSPSFPSWCKHRRWNIKMINAGGRERVWEMEGENAGKPGIIVKRYSNQSSQFAWDCSSCSTKNPILRNPSVLQSWANQEGHSN